MKRIKENAPLLLGVGFVVLLFYFTGIGCPIKWSTGISCAGCGFTRAVLWALQLQFQTAFSYHPLFWTLPLILVLFMIRDKIPNRLGKVLLWIFTVSFLTVYVIRLINPTDSIVVFDLESGFIARVIRILK